MPASGSDSDDESRCSYSQVPDISFEMSQSYGQLSWDKEMAKETTSCGDSKQPVHSSFPGISSMENHPLLNSLVAYNIMTYLPRKDLLTCRLVCSGWDVEVCRLLRKELTLEFQDICHISKFKFMMDENLKRKPNRDTPFAKIYLRSSFRLGHDIAQDFFKTHGQSIRHLQIAKVGCDCGANFFQKLLFYQTVNITSLDLQIISSPIRLSPTSEYSKHLRLKSSKRLPSKWKLPNLKNLHLRHQLFVERPRFIEDLLEAVVNLESLTTDEASPLFCRNVFIPKVLSSRNRWNKLKHLQVGDMLCFSNEQLVKFSELKFRLELLPLNFNILVPSLEKVDVNSLMTFLVSLQGTLKRLELFNHRPDLLVDLKSFPYMKKLEYLKVTNITFPSSALDGLPNLKFLSVVHEDATIYNSFFNLKIPPRRSIHSVGICPLSALNLSHLRDWMVYWDSHAKKYVDELSFAFPCLRTLSINGNDAVLKNIYKKMPLLESLTVHGPITDEGITGIPLELCQRMHSEQDYGLLDSDELDQLDFIGDLKRLRKLTISSMGNRSLLSEVSVFLGFVCCTDLVHLEVGSHELVNLWKEEIKRLNRSPFPS